MIQLDTFSAGLSFNANAMLDATNFLTLISIKLVVEKNMPQLLPPSTRLTGASGLDYQALVVPEPVINRLLVVGDMVLFGIGQR